MRWLSWMAGALVMLVQIAAGLECYEFGLVGGANFRTLDSHSSGGCLALACNDRSVRLYDAANPDLPAFVDRIDFADSVHAVHVSLNVLYVGLGNGTMRVYDVQDPASPQFVRSLTVSSLPVRDFVEYEDRLLVCGSSVVRLYTIADRSNPTQTDSQSSGTSTMIGAAVSEDGDYFVVADGYHGIVVYVHDHLGHIDFLSGFDTSDDPYFARQVECVGEYVYVADGDLVVLDASNPAAPVFVERIDVSAGNALADLALAGTTLFGADGFGGVRILDVADPSAPVVVGAASDGSPLVNLSRLDENLVCGNASGAARLLGIACHSKERVLDEDFDRDGALPPGWTLQSLPLGRSLGWAASQDAGSDYAMQVEQQPFQDESIERLISPWIDLTNFDRVELQYDCVLSASDSRAAVVVRRNGAFQWEQVELLGGDEQGLRILDLSSLVDHDPATQIAFEFTARETAAAESWRIDEVRVLGRPAEPVQAPVAFAPNPAQPMSVPWRTRTGSVGCRWLSNAPLEPVAAVRIDANGDGDYDDGGAEDWSPVTGSFSGDTLVLVAPVEYGVDGWGLRFEFRARTIGPDGLWGYSGFACAEGPFDDWGVYVVEDSHWPVFVDPVPAGQPEPAWFDQLAVHVGVTVADSAGAVDGSSLARRVDWNGDGLYDLPDEGWTPLPVRPDSDTLTVLEELTFAGDGQYRVEYRAWDRVGHGPVHSLGAEGPEDDIRVWIDTQPPTPCGLYVDDVDYTSATIAITQGSSDVHFERYAVFYDTTDALDFDSPQWSSGQDAGLADSGAGGTLLTGLLPCTPYWFALAARDVAGRWSELSPTDSAVTAGIPVEPIDDLTATVVADGVLLDWSEPDAFSGDVAVQSYEVHLAPENHPWFDPDQGTLYAVVGAPPLLVPYPPSGNGVNVFRVVTRGCGALPSGAIAFYPLNGNGKDVGPFGHDGASVGTDAVADRFDVAAGALRFDEPFDQVVTGWNLDSLLTGFTISFWMRADSYEGAYFEAVSCYGGGGSGWTVYVSGSGELVFFGNSQSEDPHLSVENLVPGAWHHVVGVADGDQHRLYVDGVERDASIRAWGPSATGTLRFGRAAEDSELQIVADLDEVLLFDTPLTQEEIQILHGRRGWPVP